MKLNQEIINQISNKIKVGIYAKVAARAEGITERTFYRWKLEGEELLKRVTNKEGDIPEEEFAKLTETEMLKCQFCQSIDRSDAEAESVLIAKIQRATDDDWKAAEAILSRRFPERWAKKDYLHVEGEIDNKPDQLKEFEEEFLADIPASKMVDLANGMEELIKNASSNGKHASQDKG